MVGEDDVPYEMDLWRRANPRISDGCEAWDRFYDRNHLLSMLESYVICSLQHRRRRSRSRSKYKRNDQLLLLHPKKLGLIVISDRSILD